MKDLKSYLGLHSLLRENLNRYLKGYLAANNTLHSANGIYAKNPINLIDDTELLENSARQKAAVLEKFHIC